MLSPDMPHIFMIILKICVFTSEKQTFRTCVWRMILHIDRKLCIICCTIIVFDTLMDMVVSNLFA